MFLHKKPSILNRILNGLQIHKQQQSELTSKPQRPRVKSAPPSKAGGGKGKHFEPTKIEPFAMSVRHSGSRLNSAGVFTLQPGPSGVSLQITSGRPVSTKGQLSQLKKRLRWPGTARRKRQETDTTKHNRSKSPPNSNVTQCAREEQKIRDRQIMNQMVGQPTRDEEGEGSSLVNFKAKPVPKHVFKPVFQQMVENQPKR